MEQPFGSHWRIHSFGSRRLRPLFISLAQLPCLQQPLCVMIFPALNLTVVRAWNDMSVSEYHEIYVQVFPASQCRHACGIPASRIRSSPDHPHPMPQPLKVLFVCGRNRRRSPTAETIFRGAPRLSVRSAGTSDSSKRRITEGDLLWADLILVMERKYAARIRALFPDVAIPAMFIRAVRPIPFTE